MQDMVMPELEFQDSEGVLREMVSFLKSKNKIAREKELYEKIQSKRWI